MCNSKFNHQYHNICIHTHIKIRIQQQQLAHDQMYNLIKTIMKLHLKGKFPIAYIADLVLMTFSMSVFKYRQ